MKHLQQDTLKNCGQTCMAMITGLKIRTVERRMKKTGPTYYKNLAAFLNSRSLGVSSFYRWCQPGVPPERAAILMVRKKRANFSHWVVLYRGKVYDPSYPFAVKAKIWSCNLNKKSWRVTSYFEYN